MSVFHEVDFPFSLAASAIGGPYRRTEIISLVSGREERNTPWANSLRRWDLGPAIKSRGDIHQLIAFFEARRGPLHGFRFRDPLDHTSSLSEDGVHHTDQLLAQGDGTQTRFALTKTYESGPNPWVRPILKPVVETLRAGVNGMRVEAGWDDENAQLLFAEPPAAGATVSAGYIFDCPVRFDTERLEIALDLIDAGTLSLPLVELRL